MLGSFFRKATKRNSVTKSGLGAHVMIGAFAALLGGVSLPAYAQEMETFDPNAAFETAEREAKDNGRPAAGAIDGDIAASGYRNAPALDPRSSPIAEPGFTNESIDGDVNSSADWDNSAQMESWGPDTEADTASDIAAADDAQAVPEWADPAQRPAVADAAAGSDTYAEDDLIGAAEGVFGKGAKGLAGLIEDLLRKQGEPNGYIVGREAGGAFIFGARYGSGTLHHKIEGERQVYWTGPSLGFDAGANAGNTFVLVYNLFDSEDLFRRYPAGEGQAYLVGGLHASYMRRGDVVLIPIRVGAGLRLGVNAGYMRFSKKQRWLPF